MRTSQDIADIAAKVRGIQSTILLLMQYYNGECDRLDDRIIDNLLEGLQLEAEDIARHLDDIALAVSKMMSNTDNTDK